jgi:hypothetical protein
MVHCGSNKELEVAEHARELSLPAFDLSLVEPAYIDPETAPSITWMDLPFEFEDRKIFSDQLPVAPPARLRTVANAITELAPSAASELDGKPAAIVRADMHTYMKAQINIGDLKMPHNRFMSPSELTEFIWNNELAPTNHPIVQAFRHVQEMNAQRVAANLAGARIQPTISAVELKTLAVDLTMSFRQKTIRDLFKEKIQEARNLRHQANSKDV